MAEVKWIKLATDVFDNRKIRQIETMPDGDSIIVVWIKLLCLAGTINDNGLIYLTRDVPYTDEMLANQFSRPLTTVRLALTTFEKFGMIEIVDSFLSLSSWEKYQNTEGLNRVREQTRARVAKHRDEQRQLPGNVTVTLPVTQCNATDKNREEEDKNSTLDDLQSSNVEEFYESIWQLYPRKVGKGAVSKTKKQVLYRIGYNEMKRAIERYQAYIKAEGKEKYIMHGSTFFNSGYVDFLDKNYEAAQTASTQKPKAGHFETITNEYGREETIWKEDEC